MSFIILAGEEAGPKSNKLGGVWNVINAEAKILSKIAEEEIILAGPYFEKIGQDWSSKQRITDTSEFKPIENEKIQKALDSIPIEFKAGKKDGINYILFNAEEYLKKIVEYDGKEMKFSDAVKAEAYHLVGLNSLAYETTGYGREYTHYLNLSHAISEFVKALLQYGKVSLHCHEFPVFYALARLEKLGLPAKTVATFHATKVGRTWGSKAIEKILHGDASWHPSTQVGLAELERLARYADVVTFVSDTTRAEARLFYGIDGVVVRNGIEVKTDRIDWERKTTCLKKIQNFLSENLAQVHGIEVKSENILPIYTISRIEIENKGYPDLIDSLIILDRILKNRIENGEIDKDTKVFCLLITAHGPKDPKKLPKGFPIYLPAEILVGEEIRLRNMIIERDLDPRNLKKRAVCAVLYPQWIGKNDGALNMSLDEIAAGCIAGIFPSRYDPFLLTALEAGREACPVVISRACGFSGFVRELQRKKGLFGGVVLVDNITQTYLETITDYALGLSTILYAFLRDKAKDKMMCDMAFLLAREMNWEEPVKKYYEILRE